MLFTAKRRNMSFDFGTISLNSALWLVAIVIAGILAFIAIKFFYQHILHFLLRGCAFLSLIIALLVILHYLKVF
jgi:hypothetical protein